MWIKSLPCHTSKPLCPKYLDSRIQFILPKYYTQPFLKRFCQLINIKNADVTCKLAAFVHHVLQRQSAPELVFALRPEAFFARINE